MMQAPLVEYIFFVECTTPNVAVEELYRAVETYFSMEPAPAQAAAALQGEADYHGLGELID